MINWKGGSNKLQADKKCNEMFPGFYIKKSFYTVCPELISHAARDIKVWTFQIQRILKNDI